MPGGVQSSSLAEHHADPCSPEMTAKASCCLGVAGIQLQLGPNGSAWSFLTRNGCWREQRRARA